MTPPHEELSNQKHRLPKSGIRAGFLTVVLIALCAGQTSPADISGKWQLELAFPSIGLNGIKLDISLEQRGANLTGAAKTATGENKIKGTINADGIQFTEIIEGGANAEFKGKQTNANTLEGTMDAPPYGAGNWTAKR